LDCVLARETSDSACKRSRADSLHQGWVSFICCMRCFSLSADPANKDTRDQIKLRTNNDIKELMKTLTSSTIKVANSVQTRQLVNAFGEIKHKKFRSDR
jgi:hypothetical protein